MSTCVKLATCITVLSVVMGIEAHVCILVDKKYYVLAYNDYNDKFMFQEF